MPRYACGGEPFAARRIVSAAPGPTLPLPDVDNTGASAMPPQARLITATLALVAGTTIAAQSADDLKLPTGYRNWFHGNTMVVDKGSPLFDSLGGMHNVYANPSSVAALNKGGPYPTRRQFVTYLHAFTITDGSYVEGARKGVATLIKDARKYASTGGWGCQVRAERDATK